MTKNNSHSMHISNDGKIRPCSTDPDRCPFKNNSEAFVKAPAEASSRKIISSTAVFFHKNLLDLPYNHPAIQDLEKRKIPKSLPYLGWAPKKDTMEKWLKKQHWIEEDMLKSGIIDTKRNDRTSWKPTLSNRLTIGQYDEKGFNKFYGRCYDDRPKYMKTNETNFDAIKGNRSSIFFLPGVESNIRKDKEVIVVEGQFDAVSCNLAGLTNTVALGGASNFHQDEYDKFESLVGDEGKIVMVLDSDEAGVSNMVKIAHRFPDANISTVVLPDGEDPCSYRANNGDKKLTEVMSERNPIHELVVNNTNRKSIPQYIANITNNDIKNDVVAYASEYYGVSREELIKKSESLEPNKPQTKMRPKKEHRLWVKALFPTPSGTKGASLQERIQKSDNFKMMAGIVAAARRENKINELKKYSGKLPKILLNNDDETVVKDCEDYGEKGSFNDLVKKAENNIWGKRK